MIVAVACAAVGIEQIAGYYECQLCQDRHVPAYWQTMLASHIVRNRYTKCPNCEKPLRGLAAGSKNLKHCESCGAEIDLDSYINIRNDK